MPSIIFKTTSGNLTKLRRRRRSWTLRYRERLKSLTLTQSWRTRGNKMSLRGTRKSLILSLSSCPTCQIKRQKKISLRLWRNLAWWKNAAFQLIVKLIDLLVLLLSCSKKNTRHHALLKKVKSMSIWPVSLLSRLCRVDVRLTGILIMRKSSLIWSKEGER